MAITIVGVFDAEQTAHFLRQEIKERGISERDIETLSWKRLSEGNDPWNINPKGTSDTDVDINMVAHFRSWGIPGDDSRGFADALHRGKNVVLARARNKKQVDEVTRLMEQNEALDRTKDSGLSQQKEESRADDHRDDDQLASGEHAPYANASSVVASSEHSFEGYESRFRQHFERYFAERANYEDYRPAYRYGYAFGTSGEHSQRSYEKVEPELRQSFEAQHGQDSFDEYRDAARYAFNRTRNHIG